MWCFDCFATTSGESRTIRLRLTRADVLFIKERCNGKPEEFAKLAFDEGFEVFLSSEFMRPMNSMGRIPDELSHEHKSIMRRLSLDCCGPNSFTITQSQIGDGTQTA